MIPLVLIRCGRIVVDLAGDVTSERRLRSYAYADPVEFVDESETHLPPGDLRRGILRARDSCGELLAGFRQGRVVREGGHLAMIGLPNVGKSSLFNRLLAKDRAIVTEVAGTTRDTLEEELSLEGIPVRLVDTAGLREVTDRVEPGLIFSTFHFPESAANFLTNPALDPQAKIPEYKVCAVRVEAA